MADATSFSINVELQTDDNGEPKTVTITNFGGVPRGALVSIAEEALDRFFGSTYSSHHWQVQRSPIDDDSDDVRVFEAYILPWRRSGKDL